MSWKEDLKYYKSFTVTISGWSFYYIGFAGIFFFSEEICHIGMIRKLGGETRMQ